MSRAANIARALLALAFVAGFLLLGVPSLPL